VFFEESHARVLGEVGDIRGDVGGGGGGGGVSEGSKDATRMIAAAAAVAVVDGSIGRGGGARQPVHGGHGGNFGRRRDADAVGRFDSEGAVARAAVESLGDQRSKFGWGEVDVLSRSSIRIAVDVQLSAMNAVRAPV
jgi:hypothetical protein